MRPNTWLCTPWKASSSDWPPQNTPAFRPQGRRLARSFRRASADTRHRPGRVGTTNSIEDVETRVRAIAAAAIDDGLAFDPGTVRSELIRDEADYAGVRVHVVAELARARIPIHIDVNFGDPIWPAPQDIVLPTILGGEVRLLGYPLPMVLAEKIVTAIDRGTANTRWRDFRRHPGPQQYSDGHSFGPERGDHDGRRPPRCWHPVTCRDPGRHGRHRAGQVERMATQASPDGEHAGGFPTTARGCRGVRRPGPHRQREWADRAALDPRVGLMNGRAIGSVILANRTVYASNMARCGQCWSLMVSTEPVATQEESTIANLR